MPTVIQSLRDRIGKIEKGRLRRPLVIGAAAVVAASGVGVCANSYMLYRTRDSVFSKVADVPPRDVAIVLGAKVYSDGTPSIVLRDRLTAALSLYNAGKVNKIIVSGDHMAKEYNEPGAMFQFLIERGVPAKDVFMDHAGFRTFDTMARAKAVFGVKSAVICTQRFHLARSVYLATINGLDAVGLEADLRRYRHHYINHGREFVARSFALLDVHLFHTQPRYLGETVDLNSDAQSTHDL
ncbi:MAG: YdcF family protein [Deltaproteobacteria bacterium]|nr:YdcF family protein [Deltaproteobacteria bacterium]